MKRIKGNIWNNEESEKIIKNLKEYGFKIKIRKDKKYPNTLWLYFDYFGNMQKEINAYRQCKNKYNELPTNLFGNSVYWEEY